MKKTLFQIISLILLLVLCCNGCIATQKGDFKFPDMDGAETVSNEEKNDTLLNDQITALIDKYGVASTQHYEQKHLTFDDCGWTKRVGILSAKLTDLDGDSMNELVTVRLEKFDLKNNKGKLEVEVFYVKDDRVKSAGKYELESTNDCEVAQINIYTYKIKGTTYLCYERDSEGLLVDYRFPEYYVFKYNNNSLEKVMRLYQAYIGTSGTNLTQTKWKNGKKVDTVIQANYWEYYENGGEKHVDKGKYKNSKNPFDNAMFEFGFEKSNRDMFDNPKGDYDYLSYAYQKPADLICSISTRQLYDSVYDATESYVKDYSNLNHDNATSKPEKIARWKEIYLNFLKTDAVNVYNSAKLICLNDDEIPELILESGSRMPGPLICWVNNDAINTYDVGASDGVNFIAKEGYIFSGMMKMGNEYFCLMRFDGKKVKKLHMGSIIRDYENESNTIYTLDGEDVSKSQQSAVFDKYEYDSYFAGEDLYDIVSTIKKY